MKYGYARVSTDDQTPALQMAANSKPGCWGATEQKTRLRASAPSGA